jgi:two-component system, NarL family, nitrate/nitrite response regulator NarL
MYSSTHSYDTSMEEQLVTRLLVFTDEPFVARGLEALLMSQHEFTLAGICPQVSRIAETVEASKPDILLIDMTPEVTFQLLLDLQDRFPECRIVLWVHSIPIEVAYHAMEHGIRGILRKALPTEKAIACMRIVAAGGLWFDEVLEANLRNVRRINLSPRESQLVNLLTTGLKNKEIASTLFLSEGTVKVYMSRLFQKLGVKDRFELALYGLKNMAGAERATEAGQPHVAQPPRKNPECAPLIHSLVLDRLSLRA